jgi:protein-tyrosine kinase
LRTEPKPEHLIERAAARLTVPWGEMSERQPSAPDTVARLDVPRPRGILPAPTSAPPTGGKATPAVNGNALARAGLIDRTQRRSRIAEEFRIVQSKLLREAFGGNGVAATERGNLIMVTSALPGEGKTFVALNLAAGISRQGDRRALLVDADIKPRSVGQMLGVGANPGLLDLVRSSELAVEDLIVSTAVENLDILPRGSGVDGGAELFASKRMAEVLEGLSRRYPDRPIILDGPPCLSSSNPHVLAPVVGQVIVVVAAGSTQQGDLEAALDLVQHCQHVSLLLNKIASWNLHSFGAYAYAYASPSA